MTKQPLSLDNLEVSTFSTLPDPLAVDANGPEGADPVQALYYANQANCTGCDSGCGIID